MTLSALIHKNKMGKVATLTVATAATLDINPVSTVAKVASVTVAKPPEPKAEHADWLQRMNPKPTTQTTPNDDDRRHCGDCANLSHGGRCLAAWRGEILAGGHYKPIDDLPRRCVGYAPKVNDPDQRTGAERWPNLKS
jgi:hypothetical protein